MDGLEVRPIVESDMDLLRASFDEGTPEQPEGGLAKQRDGTGDFLIAFLQGEPAGYLALSWDADPHAPVAWQGNVANLSDFVVLERFRSRGIGTEMLRVAEATALRQGFRWLALGVGIENDGARRLYERLGYVDAGLPPVTDGGSFRTWDGRLHRYEETWRFMLKELVGHVMP